MPKSLIPETSHLTRVRAAAEQLHALATARTDAYRQRQLETIDWALVADEFESVVARYETSIERYAAQVIQGLQSISISYKASVEMELAMADLESHLVYFELADVDRAIAETWRDLHDEQAVARGIAVATGLITSLRTLRPVFEKKQALHRKLDRNSVAYRDGWPVSYTPAGVDALLTAVRLPQPKRVAAIVANCSTDWARTAEVLHQALQQLEIRAYMPVLAELASAIPAAVASGAVELQGGQDMWQYNEIRRI